MKRSKRKLSSTVAVGALAAVAALTLSACGSGQPGSAAMVGNTFIPEAQLTQEVEQVVNKLGVSPSGQVNRVLLQRLVLQQIVDQLAAEHNITVSEGAIQSTIDKQAKIHGSVAAFETSLLQSGIPSESVNNAVKMSLQLQQLGDQLAPGKSDNEKQMAVSMAALNLAGQEGVEINPRFGVWDLPTLQIGEPPNTLSEPELIKDNGLVPMPAPQ